jgi:hypothetical protein
MFQVLANESKLIFKAHGFGVLNFVIARFELYANHNGCFFLDLTAVFDDQAIVHWEMRALVH